MSDNPLLAGGHLPSFTSIEPDEVVPAIERLLDENRARLGELLETSGGRDLVVELERMSHQLGRAWSPVSHLNAVRNTPALREAYNACLPRLSEYATDLGHNERLYQALREVAAAGAGDDPELERLLELTLKDFELAGVALHGEAKAEFKQLMQELTSLSARFEQNVLDSTDAWSHHVADDATVSGIPQSTLARARSAAEAAGRAGWLFRLDPPTYVSIMAHADDAGLRRTFYEAWVTRAAERGPHDPALDNTGVMQRILAARQRVAELLGYPNFAEYSLAKKMAPDGASVLAFLHELAARSRPAALAEMRELETLAGRSLEAWDVAYYTERLRQQRFRLSEEDLRPYFPAQRVLEGLFRVAERLFGVRIVPREGVEVWHPDVTYYELRDARGTVTGGFFVDLYARAGKRGGAWMDECVVRSELGGELELPVAYLVCNFSPPHDETPSLLTHQEVVTLFHEFGHTLHHVLTRVRYPSVAGINGVPWDAVELPSQFLENYAWLPEVLSWISAHHESGERLSDEMIETLRRTRTFGAGMQTVRQLEFALFDFRLHSEYRPDGPGLIGRILDEVRREVAVVRVPEFNRFANSFSHIFGGGYAAGYYSYKWAEVLAADAFDAFETHGVFDTGTAQRFADEILARGGSVDAMAAFRAFRGREPSLEPLLRQSGLTGKAA